MNTQKTEPRASEFKMPIQGGMLEALGINMYANLGKCLVEFIANAHDGEASRVDISIPVEEITAARKAVRGKAKKEVAEGKRTPFDVLLDTLPDNVEVSIVDNGHGMTWKEVGEKFLPLNRKRRQDAAGRETNLKSETGRVFVMGRKGLGKLAGFGAASTVSLRTKRKGETFATLVTLEDALLKTAPNVSEVPIPANYEDGRPTSEHGTTIKLACLKADAVREGIDVIKDVIREAFYAIKPEEFSIYINGEQLKSRPPTYEFIWPKGTKAGNFASDTFEVEDVGKIPIKYFVGFRKRGQHLPARKRGARIYCNHRLAAGPTLLSLPTGMHYFHSSDYMECIVEADELDREAIDFINTNRSQLKEDNEVVRALLAKVTDIMTKAIAAHGKFRDEQAEEEVRSDPRASALSRVVEGLPSPTRKPALKLLNGLASQFGVDSPEFADLAPVLISSVNATDVLVRLIELQTNPETLANIAQHLHELGEIEKIDALKLYRGRRSGIVAMQTFMEHSLDQWGKKHLEKDLHNLLKQSPWLIRSEFSHYTTSDADMNKVVTQIAKELKLDAFAPVVKDDSEPDETRPDLVFLMSDQPESGPHVVNVVELKSPTFGLNYDHYRQLEDYLDKVEQWCSAEFNTPVSVRGYLIGAMPDATNAGFKQRQLLTKFQGEGAEARIRIMGLTRLLKEAKQAHLSAIQALAKDVEAEDSIASKVKPPKPAKNAKAKAKTKAAKKAPRKKP